MIAHSDRGSQYCSAAYQALLEKHGLICSMSGKGNFFNQQEWWLEPFIGFIYRGDRDRLGGMGY